MLITQKQLIQKLKQSKEYYHLAKQPIPVIKSGEQSYLRGFNIGGRPNGFWFATGGNWLRFTTVINSVAYPPCCYLYSIKFDPSRVLTITNDNFDEFDRKYPSYWINYDYYGWDGFDYTNGKSIIYDATKVPGTNVTLQNHKNITIRDLLLAADMIFDDPVKAVVKSDFYSKCEAAGIGVDRFRVKEWGPVSKDYGGVIFDMTRTAKSPTMKYFWFQSLDINSGCIWDPSIVSDYKLAFNKKDTKYWTSY